MCVAVFDDGEAVLRKVRDVAASGIYLNYGYRRRRIKSLDAVHTVNSSGMRMVPRAWKKYSVSRLYGRVKHLQDWMLDTQSEFSAETDELSRDGGLTRDKLKVVKRKCMGHHVRGVYAEVITLVESWQNS